MLAGIRENANTFLKKLSEKSNFLIQNLIKNRLRYQKIPKIQELPHKILTFYYNIALNRQTYPLTIYESHR